MRLLLHGRLQSSQLIRKLEQEIEKSTGAIGNSPAISYSTLLLSNWNLNEIDVDVLNKLEQLLAISQQQSVAPIYDMILQNCTGDAALMQRLVAMLLHRVAQANNNLALGQRAPHPTSLTVRYDKQRKMPMAVAAGLLEGAMQQSSWNEIPPLHSLVLKGLTLTADTALLLQEAMEHLPTLQELTIRGNFTLHELDKKQSSIIGKMKSSPKHDDDVIRCQEEMECIVDLLFETLQSLPTLKVLDLQECHLPDQYLADVLEGVYPNALRTLKLKGNMCEEESHNMLCGILARNDCSLQELDLSWQRLPSSKKGGSKGCGILDIGLLCKSLAKNRSLQKLDVSDNRLRDEDVNMLGAALTRNTSLKSVRMQNCRISTCGILALAATLPRWSEQFTNLYIDGQQSIEKSIDTRKKIYQALLKNVYLKEFELPGSCKSKNMEWVLELNQAGRRALLSPSYVELYDLDTTSSSSSGSDGDDSNHTKRSGVSSSSSSTTLPLHDSLWPMILERADRVSRQEYLMEDTSNMKAASAVYLLLRERGYQAFAR
jgi:hypothetical protein